MSTPKFDELISPTLQALHSLGGSASVTELEETIAKQLNLTDEDITDIHRGSVTKFSYRLAWARNYLKRYGLINNSSRGIWALTSEGIHTKIIDKEEVKKKVRSQSCICAPIAEENDSLPGFSDDESESEREVSWKEELLTIIKAISPSSFENLCKRLLRESGFINVEVTGKSGDGGIDGKGVVKVGGLLSFHVIFQAKRYRDTVPTSVVRDFRGAMVGRADKGLIITTGSFTRDARAEAQRDGAPPIDLIDGEELIEKLKSLSIGVETTIRSVEEIQIDKEWFKNI